MKTAWSLTAVAFAAIALSATGPASAGRRLVPVIPPEIGIPPLGPAGWAPYRCDAGPVYNFYHNALYSQAPAVHGDYVYRPYYRYSAYRVVPRTYVCGEIW
jgi:hypothetical protein